MTPSIPRRTFLAGAAASLPLGWAAAQTPARTPGLVVRQLAPENLEMPFATLDAFVTPTERFFVRNRFTVPTLAAADWALEVGGAVERPFRLTYAELVRMATRTTIATLECAGNNRLALVPRVRGLAWDSGAVGNAEWTGVPLAALLERAGLRGSAVDVVLEGADRGTVSDEPTSPGPIAFARSVPVAKARADVLLAFRMNGQDLTAAHGFPVRAIVPGWYGMASIKWLTKITVLDRPFAGYFQTMDYSYWDRSSGQPALRPIEGMNVKALIARPAGYEVVPAGMPYRVFGAAWAGEADVTRVEVSVDGGATWAPATLLGDPVRYAWRLWEHQWPAPQPGRRTLMARATDSRGRVQPDRHDPDRRNYMIHHTIPVPVDVR